MHEQVTVLGPRAASTGGSGVSELPPDLLEQVRGRLRLLALLLLLAFAIGPVLHIVTWVVGTLRGDQIPRSFTTEEDSSWPTPPEPWPPRASGWLPARAMCLPRASTRSGWSIRW